MSYKNKSIQAIKNETKNMNELVSKSRNKETGGVGLGLAIAKSIANINGAEIKLESELGKGSNFILIFKGANLKWQKR